MSNQPLPAKYQETTGHPLPPVVLEAERRVQATALAEKLLAQKASQPSGGVKYDQGKPRMDLVPVRPLLDEARVWAFGAAKYADRNWELGMDWSRPYAAALRHLVAWWGGENTDPETGYSHLAHARCCLAMLQEFETTHPELDNRPQ